MDRFDRLEHMYWIALAHQSTMVCWNLKGTGESLDSNKNEAPITSTSSGIMKSK